MFSCKLFQFATTASFIHLKRRLELSHTPKASASLKKQQASHGQQAVGERQFQMIDLDAIALLGENEQAVTAAKDREYKKNH